MESMQKRLKLSICLVQLRSKIRHHYGVMNTSEPLFKTKVNKKRNGYLCVASKPFPEIRKTIIPMLLDDMEKCEKIWRSGTEDVLTSHKQVKFADLMSGEVYVQDGRVHESKSTPYHGLDTCKELYNLNMIIRELFAPLFPEHSFFQVILMKTVQGLERSKWKGTCLMHSDFTEENLEGCSESDLPVIIVLPLEDNYSLEIGNYLGPHGKPRKPTKRKFASVHLGGFLICDARQYHTSAVPQWDSTSSKIRSTSAEKTTQCTRLHITMAKKKNHITHKQQTILTHHYDTPNVPEHVSAAMKEMFEDD